MNQAGKPVAGLAPDAGAVRHIAFVQHDRARCREWMVAGSGHVLEKLLNARLLRYWRTRIGSTGRRLGRILAAQPVHVIHLLRFGVVRLQILVADRPGWGGPVVMAKLSKIFAAQTK